VVEHSIGNGEVDSSILSGSTSLSLKFQQFWHFDASIATRPETPAASHRLLHSRSGCSTIAPGLGDLSMLRSFAFACLVHLAVLSAACAAGPFGSIHIGAWNGGAYTDDNTGAFSHCGASTNYASGVTLVVGQNANASWLLGFSSSGFHLTVGETFPLDITFDGQSQVRLFTTAISPTFISAVLPPAAARDFQKASLMVAVSKGGSTFQFNLTSTGPLLSALASCVTKVKAVGVANAGDFSAPKPAVAKPAAAAANAPADANPSAPKSAKNTSQSGTGFVISSSGHVVTNNHVVAGCVGDIHGNLNGESPVALRVVSSDETNDLALLQAPGSFKEVATIRDKAIHPGDTVVAIGYPFHGLLTSDFTVTTGIVSSLSGVFNDTRYLQISAAVQPGNSGGPLLDTNGQIVGMVAAKLNALKIAKATGDIPENINFAIKTGMIRDFLDNSVVPYQTSQANNELKTADIARNARAYTLLISCTATEQADAAKK
jgi:S1-C subfamily serine protease